MIRLVRTLLDVFAGKRPLRAIEPVMSERVIHKNFLITQDGRKRFEEKQGIQEWKTWAILLRKAVKNLSVAEEDLFVRGNQVFAVFRWVADTWHPSIKGNPKHSNFVYAKYTIENGQITVTETCRQNYIFMFGTNFSEAHLGQAYKELLGFPAQDRPQTVISGFLEVERHRHQGPSGLKALLQKRLAQLLAGSKRPVQALEETHLFLACSRDVPELGLRHVQRTDVGESSVAHALLNAVKAVEPGHVLQAIVLSLEVAAPNTITAGAVLLQPLTTALAEDRPVHAIIKGLAISKADPNNRQSVHAQTLSALYAKKKIPAESIQAVYASAAAVPDPLSRAYRQAFGNQASAVKPQTYRAVDDPMTTGMSGLLQAVHSLKGRSRVALDSISQQGTIGHVVLDGFPTEKPDREQVAIIGMAGVMPGSADPEAFWRNLFENKDLLSDIKQRRWGVEPGSEEPVYAGLLEDVAKFDAAFFNLSPKEAELMDPQQRLMLQVVWQAVEHSANPIVDFANDRTAVLIGSSNQDYKQLFQDGNGKVEALNYTGLETSMPANRIARLLNSSGPCQTMNTECATTLVALHHAANLIRSGEVDRAVVGAVNVLLHRYGFEVRDKNGLLAKDQSALPFDKDSKGYLRGEGAGAFILKRLDLAKADRDHILAVVKGSAINQSQNALSLTAPQVASQTKVILDAWEAAAVDPATITYIETHANGYVEGDVVEAKVLKKAFSEAFARRGTTPSGTACAVTSVKSAIGHLEAASGVSMLLKVMLAFKHKQILGIKGLRTVNPRIDLRDAPFFVCKETQPWENLTDERGRPIPRRAGVNSFGVGGTNAHVLLEEYLDEPVQEPIRQGTPVLITVSAKTEARLKQIAANLHDHLQCDTPTPGDLQSLAFTLHTGRQAMRERLALVVSDVAELRDGLKAFTEDRAVGFHRGTASPTPAKLDPGLIETAFAQTDLPKLAAWWVDGVELDWAPLYDGVPVRKLALPTYPFAGKSYWLPHQAQPPVHENQAVAFYSFWAGESGADYQEEYLTFCPFPEKIPGFSLTRIFLNPAKYQKEMNFVREKQIEMRRVLFYKEDYQRIQTILDFGCGHGTDVIQFAKRYPHVRTHGFTITKDQAELGNKRIAEHNLGSRAKIFHKNSAEDRFPDMYDLIIGIEVSFHIRNKDGLFGNISSSLKPGGRVLLMDFLANLRGAIVDPNVEISIPTQAEWVELLSRHGLIIDELIDVSPEVANFLYDPEFEQHIQGFPKVVRDTYTNYVHQSHALNKNWISYCLIKLEKNDALSMQECVDRNRRKLAEPIPYAHALQEMLHPGSMKKSAPVAKPVPIEPQAQKTGNTYANVAEVKAALQTMFMQVLKFDREALEAAATFAELGVTSITAVELLEEINREFDLNLPTSIVFEFNTFDAMAPAILAAAPKQSERPPPPKAEVPRTHDEIAVIGLACRCAGAQDQDQFWDLIRHGKDCIQDMTNPDWLAYFEAHSQKPVPRRYGRMDGLAYFDPLFFNMSPLEAATIDPAHRLVLEESYKALEDAGYAPSGLDSSRVGTFLGSMGGMSDVHTHSHFAMLGSETSILSARPAYFLNLTGPALAINTACSSSLVAMDLACRHLKHGDIDMALAGGVTIYNTPEIFVRMNHAGMLSPTGECRPFDKRANGVVVGDGIGIVILKRLQDAERDGDRIYGVIRGSGVNQDGQTTGITVPSFLSQSQLEETVYTKHQIPVEDIQYIETHGTATVLGDPIEIHALQNSFGKFTQNKSFCAIGSLKGNIGHTTAASGVLSVIKVLLSLKHRRLPPSIHFSEANEHIDFEASPFYVNTALKDWPLNGRGTRLAAVSSFGFSGTNAHMVLQEHVDKRAAQPSAPVALTLSAKSQERLKVYAQNLQAFVQEQPDLELSDLAYTLQVGRDALEHRMGLVAHSKDELVKALQDFLDEKPDAVHQGQVKGTASFPEDLQQTVSTWIARRAYDPLLRHWVKGLKIDWRRLYGEEKPRRIAAPSYPFAREVQRPAQGKTKRVSAGRRLHPLVHENTAVFQEQRFSSTFTGDEFFLADHQVQGQKTLPGVAYLEMAVAAAALATGTSAHAQGFRLKNINWLSPLTVTSPQRVHIGLVLKNQDIDYQVYTRTEPDSEHRDVHGQGSVSMFDVPAEQASLDLDELRDNMSQGRLSTEQTYAAFEAIGLQYGPGHQGIQEILQGRHQVLARIELPAELHPTQDAYLLHPCLLDSALQAIIALLNDADVSAPRLPFALEELIVTGKLPTRLWAWLRPAKRAGNTTFDLDLCDEQGRICVALKGLATRSLEGSETGTQQPSTLLNLSTVWNEVSPPTREQNDQLVIIGGTPQQRAAVRDVYPCSTWLDLDGAEMIESLSERLQALSPLEHLVWIAPNDSGNQDRKQGVLFMFRIAKALLSSGFEANRLSWTLITTQTCAVGKHETPRPAHAGVHGLAGSMAKEVPHWRVRVLDMQADADWPVREMFCLERDDVLVYRNGRWFQRALAPLRLPAVDHPPYKYRGVYVVIGGAGGLGEAWSHWVIEKYKARVFWIGRRQKDDAIQAKIDRLAQLGPAPTYLQADAADRASLETAYQAIKQEHPRIHGVIHSAIVLQDASLAKMDETRFQAGLSAKVDVSLCLAEVFKGEALDFVLFFSSLQSFLKMPGQSNYAAGCTFKDAFAEYLSRQWTCRVKVMNWGYWGNVGVVADATHRDRMARAGIGSIEPEEGMAAVEALLGSPLDQMALVKTLKPKPFEIMTARESTEILPATTASAMGAMAGPPSEIAIPTDRPQEEVEALVLKILAATLPLVNTPIPAYSRWLEASRLMIEDTPATALDALWTQWEQSKQGWREHMNEWLLLLEPCLRHLPEILGGEIKATDILFPNASLALVEGIYHGNPVADYYNAVLTDRVLNYLQVRLSCDPDANIRLFEIGAGTGGTTSGLLARLAPFQKHIAEYRYTDLSQAFLLHAQKTFDAPYLATQIFDVEKPLAAQQIDVGAYDLVIASNVLHATANMRNTLRNAKALLRRNGLLLLNEMTVNTPLHHLTFGLLKGWWLYEDAELRLPGCPGLSPQTWARILKEEGFRSVRFPAESAHYIGQQIIVAESDGFIRQAREVAPIETKPQTSPPPKQASGDRSLEALREESTTWIKKLVAETLNLASHRIDAARPLEDYGIDSILVVQLTELMRRHFDHISSTLFFEVQTIDALVDHLIDTQREALEKRLGVASPKPIQSAQPRIGKAQSEQPRIVEAPSEPPQGDRTRDVAVIGLSGRYPQAEDLHQFWQNLKSGKNCITEIPADRWDWRSWFDEQRGKPGFSYTRWGGFIDGVDRFDPLFFHISPRDAEQMDPQERLFLEVAHSSIEDAGYTARNLSETRRVGVFVGVMNSAYGFNPNYASIANRVSYTLDFQGPSLAVDTACSSSLTAIHLALESLYAGTCDCAIAGGVNLILHPGHYLSLSALTMLSSSDQCKSFGAAADGFVDGEGVGALVLKSLDKALADGDQIYGVLKASMLNSGGKTNGYTVPNPKAQADLIFGALQRAEIPARTIGYIEAHGTGTALGDPIEITGLTQAFSRDDAQRGHRRTATCAIGSVKSNIGHTESAAGIAGLTKVLLQLKHGQLVPSLHARTPNPNIDFANTPFRVQQEPAAWQRPVIGGRIVPRRAGLSSFGAGGANAHLIIEEYQTETVAAPPENTKVLIVLSAKSEDRLKAIVKNLHDHLTDPNRFGGPQALQNLAFTLQVGREAMEHRMGLIVSSAQELIDRLAQFQAGDDSIEDCYRGHGDADSLAAYSNDDALQEAVAKWIERKKYGKLLAFWVKGFAIDWERLYGDAKPRRISLPTYPFLKQRYWKPDPRKTELPRPPASIVPSKQWLSFKEQWRKQPLSLDVDWHARLARYAGKVAYLFYRDDNHKQAFLALFQQLQLISQMSEAPRILTQNIDELDLELWVDTPAVVLWLGAGQGQNDLRSVFQLSQGLMKRFPTDPIDLFYLYESDASQPHPENEALSGFMKSAMLEQHRHVWHCIGRYGEAGYPAHQLLLTEWLSHEPKAPATFVRYQNTERLTHALTELPPDQTTHSPFRSKATYLVAGGLGPLGERLCFELAKRYQATLVILARGALDDAKRDQCSRIRDLGGAVHFHAVDITDRRALQQTFAAIKREVDAINGVIHLARLVEDQPIIQKDWASFNRVIGAKVDGTRHLDELTAAEPLDFFVMFSSLAAFGIRGSADYGYATAFQNAFAVHRNELRKQGIRSGATISQCWGPWTVDRYLPQNRDQRMRDAGFELIDMNRDWSHIEAGFSSEEPVLGVMVAADPAKVRMRFGLGGTNVVHPSPELRNLLTELERQQREGRTISVTSITDVIDFDEMNRLDPETIHRIYTLLFPEDQKPKTEAKTQSIADCVRQTVQEILKLDKLGEHQSFQDCGMDSIAATQISLHLERKLNRPIKPQWFIDFSTVHLLSEFLKTEPAQTSP
ncbi:SDR family NAD(P)-dependent oxidoreductase [Sulfidibacter corallicola]|uniref:SDR family NAD(P)-dependent oxidoreductase n=1 Tax=Sulfidibacter corallicola TaxID=2818388 RepID=A0A8A4TW67_SULCO|nr:SDR family NAD(P)-dependent oxidoreductase [Sulfidibacter corallicola]QTD53418.1 SDR family NAD(P)-dependent oxidoreductase [Sulfidibacter corallicola]